MEEVFFIIGIFVRVVFIVFGVVLIVKLVILEYKNKIIFVMFMYLISWKKLFIVKFMIVGGLMFIMILLLNIFIVVGFFWFNLIYYFILGEFIFEIIF